MQYKILLVKLMVIIFTFSNVFFTERRDASIREIFQFLSKKMFEERKSVIAVLRIERQMLYARHFETCIFILFYFFWITYAHPNHSTNVNSPRYDFTRNTVSANDKNQVPPLAYC
ncbi:hypothetical protein PUN28_000961 [Cardiocondyla obscurior]|uniref:Secreted protein n=1 Tax=Cardiocondyla obscurior TaxID=286306 RepID=A0AAW2H2Q0_9HYME